MKNEEDFYKRVDKKFTELLIKSEDRIDRTNDMICECVKVIDKLTTEYTTHLKKLQESRDELLAQNKSMVELLAKSEALVEYTNKRYDLLLEKALNIAANKNNGSENNINIK